MFDPVTAQVTRLARTTVSRGLHGTASLLPDGSVFFAGEHREALVRPDDPSYPLMASWADARKGELRVIAPKLPAQAVPGIYILYVVDKNGVPSVGRQLRLMPAGSSVEFR
ncbi:MAG: galactose oxidase-like domain-containing protein [Longimicrobiales bacterium]